ncbi:hypothetical protein NDU88_001750 [Pleurodeles waltl]|uniref:Uncharacterized protein n=1 Tax=Pleurodeles waltl TaxID=8319 RepID=A0AAV7U7A7_PLEWA|nr:hypothetical protein NDU88_001750 [Pleurodeles waltl]
MCEVRLMKVKYVKDEGVGPEQGCHCGEGLQVKNTEAQVWKEEGKEDFSDTRAQRVEETGKEEGNNNKILDGKEIKELKGHVMEQADCIYFQQKAMLKKK